MKMLHGKYASDSVLFVLDGAKVPKRAGNAHLRTKLTYHNVVHNKCVDSNRKLSVIANKAGHKLLL